jgi:UDP:flavonoid glycosyltransferase YjiC (YdhE family)
MRIVFRAHPAYGHVYPLMPLAEAAREAGHEVIFPVAPPFVGRLSALGFRTIEAGVTMQEASRRRLGDRSVPHLVDGEPNWDMYSELFAEAAVHAATDLLRQLPQLGADLVVYEDTDLAGAAIAAKAGVPSVMVGTVRSLEPRIHTAFYRRPLEELLAVFGAVPRSDDPILDTFPESGQRREFLADPRRRPMRPVPWSDPSYPVPTWIGSRRRPLVFVTMGTVIDSPEPRRRVVEALGSFDIDIVLSAGAGGRAALGWLPGNVYAEPFVNQAALLPHLDLIVHHGGAGTTTGSWAHGVPQLVMPDGADRFINADAVVASGTGVALREPTVESVEKAVTMLFEDSAYRESTARIRGEVAAMPHPADVLADITTSG